MKKFTFILILFLTLSSICYARTTTSARISQARIVIGGIKLGDDMETVLKILGKPSKYTHEDKAMHSGEAMDIWYYNQFRSNYAIEVTFNVGSVCDVSVTQINEKINLKTLDGLGVGDSEYLIRKIYGEPSESYSSNDDGKTYVYRSTKSDYEALIFTVRNGAIYRMFISVELI